MKRSTLSVTFIIIAIVLLAVGIFAPDWFFYVLVACLVAAISLLAGRKK
ncbi:hypothetical protein [Marvinbryantia formatexigens]|nr:hypothetical protein [Marvinbryantia formatexigens]UWO23084.1 hypothetical protein NQ534_11475 [Marvinbryantia formatexigens DSM 14469]SDF98612.1 hypothetical protein SAMN05660368_01694 [Marvinbryantia formatexigens]